jgi:S1-C subfamily serine protease
VDDIVTQLDGHALGAGTGIVLSPDGTVLTNNHVIDGATNIRVTDVGNDRTYPASVTGYDEQHDVAVLHLVGASALATDPLGNSAQVGGNDAVLALGNAGGRGGAPTQARGEITGRNETISVSGGGNAETLAGMFETSARLEPGDSGGPLLDSSGRVIGMDTATSEQDGHVDGPGYAIPINTVVGVSQQIQSGQAGPGVHIGATALLGVEAADPAMLTAEPGAGAAQAGAVVLSVSPGTAAERAGLSVGDVITSVEGQRISSPGDLTALMGEHHPGDMVRVGWTGPDGQLHSAVIQLGAGPPA